MRILRIIFDNLYDEIEEKTSYFDIITRYFFRRL